jgi:adenine phosphoribosyltransferase
MDYKKHIASVKDFPKKGIDFKDITSLLKIPGAMKHLRDDFAGFHKGEKIDAVIGIESRGFIFGSLAAEALGCAFIPARKPGKLPREVVSADFDLEYGSDTLNIHKEDIEKGSNVIIVDDLLATGGTALCCAKLAESLGANIVSLDFMIALADLPGMDKLKDYKVNTLVTY